MNLFNHEKQKENFLRKYEFFLLISDSVQPFNLTQNPEAMKEMTCRRKNLSLWRGPTFFLECVPAFLNKPLCMCVLGGGNKQNNKNKKTFLYFNISHK